jgi:hypothetical protein
MCREYQEENLLFLEESCETPFWSQKRRKNMRRICGGSDATE